MQIAEAHPNIVNGSTARNNTISVTIGDKVGTVFVDIFGSPSILFQAVDGRIPGPKSDPNTTTAKPKAKGNENGIGIRKGNGKSGKIKNNIAHSIPIGVHKL